MDRLGEIQRRGKNFGDQRAARAISGICVEGGLMIKEDTDKALNKKRCSWLTILSFLIPISDEKN